jgi:low molecular weight phosphotyrosine protein phosphatase
MASPQEKTSVLFVCTGNICRSTMAEAVFRSLTKSNTRIGEVDSAGTHAAIYHNLDPPDPRTMQTLRKNGITGYDHASRGLNVEDFDNFDYVFAMDAWNLSEIQKKQRKRPNSRARVMLFGAYGGKSKPEEVVDPYYGADNGFDEVYEQVLRFSNNFLKKEIDDNKAELK